MNTTSSLPLKKRVKQPPDDDEYPDPHFEKPDEKANSNGPSSGSDSSQEDLLLYSKMSGVKRIYDETMDVFTEQQERYDSSSFAGEVESKRARVSDVEQEEYDRQPSASSNLTYPTYRYRQSGTLSDEGESKEKEARMSDEKHEESDLQLPPSGDRSIALTKLLDKSLGSFSFASASPPPLPTPPMPSHGNATQYLCIPVNADGTTTPSAAFLSPAPPGHVVLSNGHKKMSPIGSAGAFSTKTRAGGNLTASGGDKRMPLPNSVSTSINSIQGQHPPGKIRAARQISEILERGTPSPWDSESNRHSPKGVTKSAPATAKVSSKSLMETTPSPWKFDLPGTVRKNASSYKTPPVQQHQREIVFTGGGPGSSSMPLSSVVSGDSMVALSDGTKRVVLAKNGTPIAFIGNTMEVLSGASTPVEEQRKWQRWTDSEDEILRAAVEEVGTPHNWKRISRKYFLGVRSETQCKNRWKKALQPGLIRGCWTSAEDKIIMENMERGMKWSDIAKLLPGRIPEQVKERWVNAVDPALNKDPWTEKELEILFEAQAQLGNQWKKIAGLLPGRSENHVKNRWYNAKMAQRRKMKKLAAEAEVNDRLRRARGDDLLPKRESV